jgi:hypothetical protein
MASATPPVDPGEQTGQPTVADPENYNLQRRLRQIHNARERFPETVREEQDRVVSPDRRENGITEDRYLEIVTEALLDYLIELEPLMRNDDLETGTDYWNGFEVTTDKHGDAVTIKRIVESDGNLPMSDTDGPLTLKTARAAYRAANRFVAEAGLGVELDDGLQIESGFDSTGGA